MKVSLSLALIFCLFITSIFSQNPTADRRISQRKTLMDNSLAKNLEPVSIGPSIFSCRVTDLDVNPDDPTEFYVAYASGGLWLTKNNGTRFTPIFDHEASMTIGDIAVDWKKNVIWVGTGECNSSRSSYAGTGIYRSDNGGKTWSWRGLPESHHISRIILHPENPDVAWVAVLGHLYTSNSERGIYKTSDGGKTWRQVLFVDENSGGIDLVADPADPNTIFAATWQRSRRAWNFDGAGTGSGIWKSTDGGETFSKISTPDSGFPTGEKIGRIGLAAGRKAGLASGEMVLYASLDNQNSKPKKEDEEKKEDLTKDDLRKISVADFAKLEDEKLAKYLKDNDFSEKHTAKKIKKMVADGKIAPLALVEYLEDADNALFETDFIGAEVYRSDDGGKSWAKTHGDPLENMHFTYGYYFSNIRCRADDADQVYLIGFLILRSEDGGKTWKNINKENVHVDHHALWLSPRNPQLLVNGNDGGVNISWDNGESWVNCNQPPVGQFYAIQADNAEPYNVYGGAQDNGVYWGSSKYEASDDWRQTGQYPYKILLGGDGMQIQVDKRDNTTVYTGYQFGNYFKINKLTGETKGISPKHELGERPLRFNWQTPILLSKFNQDVLYLGANRLYRSFDKGENWEPISPDLTQGARKGNVPYGTLTTISESPMRFGLIYTGSDDGLIHVSRDGDTWKKVSDSLPQNLWVSRVQASSHSKSRVYTSLNGYRNDDFTPYLYVSENYGETWSAIGTDLPAEPVNVVREDPTNPDLLFVGTDHGVYFSLDRGGHFQSLGKDFPAVPVHDLVIQSRENELVIGTHGRSMFKISIKNLQAMTAEVLAAELKIFEISKRKFSKNWGKKEPYKEVKNPESSVWFYSKTAGKINWTVKSKDGLVLQNGSTEAISGLNELKYTLDVAEKTVSVYQKAVNEVLLKDKKKTIELKKSDAGKVYLQRGTFVFEIEKGGKMESQEFVVE